MASAQPTRLQSKSPKWRGVKGRVWGRYVVPGEGLEPSWAEARRILSPLRLPIPPSRRRGWQKQISTAYVRAAACDFHSKLKFPSPVDNPNFVRRSNRSGSVE